MSERQSRIFGRIDSFSRAAAALWTAVSFPHALQALDLARAQTGVDEAVSRFGVTGNGVIVAVLDRGIDWKNDDFRNEDGTTRIKWIFDLSDDTGATAPGNIYGMGTIYSEDDINAALSGGPALAHRDAVGHGCTTAGIICGNGRGLPSRKYRGVAPKATLIVVKIVGGAPAHDTQPAEANFFNATKVPVGMNFVRDKVAELGMPCVMLPNYGSIGGPADGTSDLCRKIDEIVRPGFIFVNGPGDEGGAANRASGTVPANGTVSLDIKKGQAGLLRLDLWYPGEDRFDVTLVTPGGTFGPYVSPAANTGSDTKTQTGNFTYYHLGTERDFYGAQNGKREIFIDFTGAAGTYTVQLKGASVPGGGRFEAGINPATFNQTAATANRFLTFVYPGNQGNIWDGSTARLNICPGDYVIRTNYTDIDGFARAVTGQGSVGQIWTGSSAGPTYDGRLGVDFASPGDSLFTVYGATTYWATSRFNMIQDGLGKYGRASAVSAAAPFATGVVALMLEMNPQLDSATAKRILQETAKADNFTGAVPNPQWGYGKLDALAALNRLADSMLKVTSFQRDGDDMVISCTTVAGKNYRVEYADDPEAAGTWTTVPGYGNVAGTGSELKATDTGGGLARRRFYRVVSLP